MTEPRDKDSWADPVERLEVGETSPGGRNINVEGRRLTGPLQGFGQMWQKTYQVRLEDADVSPTEVISVWKQHYNEFWPENNQFYAPLAGIQPGEIGLISGGPGPMKASTGVLVLYADETSWAFITPEGHPFAGWVTFSAHEDDGTVAQVQLLIRPSDPMYELGFKLGLSRWEDGIWKHTLSSLAAHFGVDAEPSMEAVLVDRRRQWRNVRNLRWNAGMWTALRPFAGRSRSSG